MRVSFDMFGNWRNAAPVVHEALPAWRRAPYRAVFISDLQLGTLGCQAEELLEFLTAVARRLWIIHGDAFDGVVQCARWLAVVGDNLYDLTLRLNCGGRAPCRATPARSCRRSCQRGQADAGRQRAADIDRNSHVAA